MTDTPRRRNSDGPEFSSDPMPAAFSACLFLAFALFTVLFAVFRVIRL